MVREVERSGAALVFAFLLLGLAAAAVQVAKPQLPVLTGSDKSMDQYESWRLHVERDGHHDLIVFGNSVARQSVDVGLLEARAGKRLGRHLIGYNFGAGGTNKRSLPILVDLAYGVDQPPILIVVVTPRMVGQPGPRARQRDRLMHASPYGRALTDSVDWRGSLSRWLLDSVSAFGARYSRGGHPQLFALVDPRRHVHTRDAFQGLDTERSSLNHLAFEIDPADHDSELKRLGGLELSPWTIEFPHMKARAIFFRDPEGNLLELICHDGSVG